MNENIFYSEDNEYKIRITKKKKFYTQSEFGQYQCTIEFYNNINLPVLIINCTEKELYLCIQRLSELESNIITLQDRNLELNTIIEFNSTGELDSYFWIVGTIPTDVPDYPVDDYNMWYISIYSSRLNKNSLRIYLPMSYSFFDTLIFNIYIVLEDLPYLDKLNDKIIEEFIKGEL